MLRARAALAALAALAGLTLALPASQRKADPVLYFPTAVGATWTYREPDSTYTMTVSKAESRGDATLVTVDVVFPDGRTQHSHTMEVSPRGLREVENFYRKYDPPVPRLRLPHAPGAKWACRIRLDGQDRGTSAMGAGPAEEVTVPAGTFRAVRVETLSTDGKAEQRLTHWYAPGVGLVRVIYRPGSSRDLTSFDPGPRVGRRK